MRPNNLLSEVIHISKTLDTYGQAYVTTKNRYNSVFGISGNQNYKVVSVVVSQGDNHHVYVKFRKQDNSSATSESVDLDVLILGY